MESKVNKGKDAIPAVFRRDGSVRTAGAVTENKGGYKIADTSTTAKVGDIYRAESGTAALIYKECVVIEANTNDFTIASKIAPANGDTFYILAPVNLRVDDSGAVATSVAGGATEAKQDTMITSLAAIETAVELIDNAISGNEMQVDVVTSALPSGASTSAKQDDQTAILSTIDSSLVDLGGTVGTDGSPPNTLRQIVAGWDGTNVKTLKTDASGELQIDVLSSALPSGAATSAAQDTAQTALDAIKTAVEILDNTVSGNEMQVDIVSSALPSGASTLAEQQTQSTALSAIQTAVQLIDNAVSGAGFNITQLGGNGIANGQGTPAAGTMRVVLAGLSSATVAAVADSASSVTLLASSGNRLGATFFNDSTEVLYLKMGATASTSSFTVKINPGGYYELPGVHVYTGVIDGIWAANASGNCLVTSW